MTEEEKDDGFMNTEYDNQKENGKHYGGYNCKCSDCQREKEKQEGELVSQPF